MQPFSLMTKNRILMEIWYTKQNTKNIKYMHGAAPSATHVMLVGSRIINSNLAPPTPTIQGVVLCYLHISGKKGEVIEQSI